MIDLPEDDPDSVDRMLHYIYTHDYPGDPDLRYQSSWTLSDDEDRGNDLCDELLKVIRMYTIADKYDIQTLRVSVCEFPHSRISDFYMTRQWKGSS